MIKGLFNKLKSIFIETKEDTEVQEKIVEPEFESDDPETLKKIMMTAHDNSEYYDEKTGALVHSSLLNKINHKRFLQLEDDTCALVIHPNHICEAILTKATDQNKEFTEEEILLMALVIHLKQDEFSDMLISELHRIAMQNDALFNEFKERRNKN